VKALSFKHNGRSTYGVLRSDGVHEASDAFRERYPDLKSTVTGDALGELEQSAAATALDSRDVQLRLPIPDPGKILCVGRNYLEHAQELGNDLPEHPMIFVRFADSLVAHDEPIVAPAASDRFDFEGELAVVIGRRARHVGREDAMHVIAGVTPFMDGTVRDWQRHTSQFTAGKNFDRSGAMGPCIVTLDEIPDVSSLPVRTRLNGNIMQDGSASDMMFDIPALVAYCSTFAVLEPGDIIATGTPPGVGAGRKPPVWLKPGDTLEVDLGPAGCLRNPIVAEAGS
jgi:2-keto-4-pentenoate hydratase/2-oxohepta-3-ene-1,7-dioic acid hydratase in catechol pathway